MSREKVGLYTQVSENARRRYEKVNPKKPYPLGTRFFLRYCDPATGKRVWEPIRADRQDFVIDVKAAIAKARIKEGDLVLGQPTPPLSLPLPQTGIRRLQTPSSVTSA